MLQSVGTVEGEAFRRSVQYEVATGAVIPNLGESDSSRSTRTGPCEGCEHCDVSKALLSVKRAMQAGNRVVFDDDGSFVEDKVTGERAWLRSEGGVFLFKLWVKKQVF
eukprot:14718184-Heterocapsa_arctica.AAC.1